jgi:outer membrane protein
MPRLCFKSIGLLVATACLGSLGQTASADSLLDIYELAVENDAQLRAQEAQYRADREQENIARASLLPQITAGWGITGNDVDTTRNQVFPAADGGFIIGDGRILSNTRDEGYDVSLSQPLFNLSAWFNYKAGSELSRQAEATLAANQQNLIVRVVEAYFNVLRAKDNLSAAEAQERALERQLEQTQQRFEVGLIAITDVYEAEAARDLAQVTRIVEENNVDVALEQLSVLTGKDHGQLKELSADFSVAPPSPTDRSAWVDFAIANNFTLAAAQFAEEAARQTAKASQMGHAPTVTATYRYSDTETTGSLQQIPSTPFNVPPESTREVDTWQLRVDMPLFSGGGVSARRRQAAEQFNSARENRINLTRTTVTQARSLHMTVLSDVARVKARQQAIVSSQSALDATEAGYQVGTRNIVDVLNAQNTLFAAQRDYANSRYDYVINTLRLKENAGILSPADLEQLNAFLIEPAAPTASAYEDK